MTAKMPATLVPFAAYMQRLAARLFRTCDGAARRIHAYIRFREKHSDIDTVRISDGVVVDMAADGILYGIELLNANDQLRRDETEKLLIVNEATGEQVEFPLATS
jgi:uncharacterized protein YuzE